MTTTDPEYDRLLNAVWKSADALRDYRTKSPSPAPTCNDSLRVRGQPDGLPDDAESCPACGALPCDWVNDPLSPSPDPVPLRVVPPEEHWGETYHWLLAEGVANDPDVFEWLPSAGLWSQFGGADLTPAEVHEIGWRYHSPCKPDTRIEPTHEAIAEWWFANGKVIKRGNPEYWISEVLRAAVAHFSPTQPAPVQQEITDDEIARISEDIFPKLDGEWVIDRGEIIKFARTILSKYSTTLSNKTLDTLYDLAKTEEREQFKNDAKMVVGRKG